MSKKKDSELTRRTFLTSAGTAGAALLLQGAGAPLSAQSRTSTTPSPSASSGRRKLGPLEVSSVGLGVQNMSRTYQTTIGLDRDRGPILAPSDAAITGYSRQRDETVRRALEARSRALL